MFGRKKQIDVEKINNFNEAVKAIKAYIYLSEWSKAKSAIDDIKQRKRLQRRSSKIFINDLLRSLKKRICSDLIFTEKYLVQIKFLED